MALVLPNSVFLHCPKTGGWWVRNAVRDLGIPTSELGHEHSNFKSGLLKLQPPEWWANRTVFLFVRHPLSWYQSIWAFRLKHGWSMIHPLDFNCASNCFPTFVERALEWWPDGWVGRTFAEFSGVPEDVRLVVGHQERLRQDLGDILRMTGDIVGKLRMDTPPANDSNMDGLSSAELAVYPPELRRKVLRAERGMLGRWYRPGWELRGPIVV